MSWEGPINWPFFWAHVLFFIGGAGFGWTLAQRHDRMPTWWSREYPALSIRLVLSAALLGQRIKHVQNGDAGSRYDISLHYDPKKLLPMLVLAEGSIADGLLNENEAVNLLATECFERRGDR